METYNLELMTLKHELRVILYRVESDREKLIKINELVNK